ncbi:MAG: hypothetical protein ACK4N5_12820 [Myxococcales bacterium]
MRLRPFLAAALLLVACGSRPDIPTTGLGRACPAEGCAAGQTCVTAAGPGGETRTCEITCGSDGECPEGHRCNRPPVVPDSIPNVCVKA